MMKVKSFKKFKTRKVKPKSTSDAGSPRVPQFLEMALATQ